MDARVPLPPQHDIELEQALLGAILVNNQAMSFIGATKPEHFYEPLHQLIFQGCQALVEAGKEASPLTIKTILPADFKVGTLSASQYLARLASDATTVINAKDYAAAIRHMWVIREGDTIMDDARRFRQRGMFPDEAVKELFSRLDLLRLDNPTQALPETVAQSGQQFMTWLNGVMTGEIAQHGASTGLTSLDKMIGGLKGGHLVIMAGRPGMGKAQPLSALVRTTDGWKAMGDLRVGDRLRSIDGRQSFVTGVFEQGEKEVFRVAFSDGRSTRACADHLWCVHYRGWDKPRVLSTAKVSEMLTRKRYQGRLWIDMPQTWRRGGQRGVELPIDPWALGALIGDGSMAGNMNFTTASLHNLKRMRAALPDSYLRALTDIDFKICARGRTKNGIRSRLRALGLFGCRSHEKFIPSAYLTAPAFQRLELLRGLLDTDGWVEKWGTVRFCTVSPQLACDVQELARSLGAWCSMSTRSPTYTHLGEKRVGRTAYVLNICHPSPRTLVTEPEKARRAPERQTARKMPTFVSIVPDGRENCRCISVSHPGALYITDEYVVTHNTTVAGGIARGCARAGEGAGMFSLEMPQQELMARLHCDEAFSDGLAAITYQRALNPRRLHLSMEEGQRLLDAQERLARLPLMFDFSSSLTVGEIAAKARGMAMVLERKFKTKLRAIIVDYIKFVKASDRYRGQRVYEIGEISASLKQLAKELDVAVILLAQLSRKVEETTHKIPDLSHLRESGDLEADADLVVFLYREAYYIQNNPEALKDPAMMVRLQECLNTLMLVVAKNRHGPTGNIEVYCNMGSSAIRDLAQPEEFPI